MRSSLVFPFCLLLVACSPQAVAPTGPEGAMEVAVSDSSAESVASSSVESDFSSSSSESSSSASLPTATILTPTMLQSELSAWVEAWQSLIPDFSLAQIQRTSQDAITSMVERTITETELQSWIAHEEELGFQMLYPSPEEKRVLFISGGIAEGSPDTEVLLIDLQTLHAERLLFCGTACSFDGAVWPDEQRFAITGYGEFHPEHEERCTEGTPCTFIPTLHIFDLQTKMVTQYRGPEISAETFLGE